MKHLTTILVLCLAGIASAAQDDDAKAVREARRAAEAAQRAALEQMHILRAKAKAATARSRGTPPQGARGQGARPGSHRLDRLFAKDERQGKVTAVANEIGLLVISIGKDHGIDTGDQFTIFRGTGNSRQLVCTVKIDRVDRMWSAGKILEKKTDPQVGDEVSGAPLVKVERKQLLDFVFSFRPVTDGDRAAVGALLDKMGADDVEDRERAANELFELGGPAWSVVQELDLDRLDPEVLARAKGVVHRFEALNRRAESEGIERDVELLAYIPDPRAHDRLKRILSLVTPFSKAGVPGPGPGLPEYLAGWWAYSKSRVRWNAARDRYEEK